MSKTNTKQLHIKKTLFYISSPEKVKNKNGIKLKLLLDLIILKRRHIFIQQWDIKTTMKQKIIYLWIYNTIVGLKKHSLLTI